jgi:hypothetical protein
MCGISTNSFTATRIFLTLLMSACASSAHARISLSARSDVPSLESIRHAVEENRNSFDAIAVTTREQVLQSATEVGSLLPIEMHTTIADNEGHFSNCLERYRPLAGGGEPLLVASFKTTFDGKRTVQLSGGTTASIDDGITFRSRSQSILFFDCNLLNNVRNKGFPDANQSLVGILESDKASVRPTLDTIEDRSCVVVDYIPLEQASPSCTVWLDLGRGFVPMKQVHYRPDGTPKFEYETSKAHEVVTGLWFVVEGTMTFHWPTSAGIEKRRFEVHRVDGEYKLNINPTIAPDTFSQVIPSGTSIIENGVKSYQQP